MPDPLTPASPGADPSGPRGADPSGPSGDDPSDAGPAHEDDQQVATGPAPRPSARSLTLSVSMLASALLATGLAVLPAPYVVESPGPTKDVLGTQGGTPLITITGATTYPTTGQLRLTTVSAVGTPGYPALAPAVVLGWLSDSESVQPVEQEVSTGQTQQQIDESNAAAMVSSQENATVAALIELGYEVPATLTVADAVSGTDAAGKLAKGDVIVSLDGTSLPDYGSLVTMLKAMTPGGTTTVGVRRGGALVQVPVTTGAREGGGARLGVYIDPTFDPPVDVKISIDGIGGPSAGTMFALGIVDRMTAQDEANGQIVAGTGTIDVTGEVGEIGGIRQKLAGARRDGARWFLAPSGNCSEVVGHVPAGLRVVRVSTLHEAREALVAIGQGTGDSLPTCTATS